MPARAQADHAEANGAGRRRSLDPSLREGPAGGGRTTQEPAAIQADRGHGAARFAGADFDRVRFLLDFTRRTGDPAIAAPRLPPSRGSCLACYTDLFRMGGFEREGWEDSIMAKHIFVTGGVVSSLGKGLTCASIGMLLEHRGLRVRLQKFDPYINVDPGTMSPYQHGEVYVLDDGGETDLDLGHYERFTDAPLTRDCNFTTGKIYLSVIQQGARGEDVRGQDRPGDPARHRRDQGGHPQAGRRRRGRRDHRDRRDRRRHRGLAVPGGDPPVRARRRPRELPLHPPDAWCPTSRRRAS